MFFFSLNIDGQQVLARLFVKAPLVVQDLSREMAKVGQVVRDRFADVFRTQGAVGGQPKWTALSEKWTVPERQKQGFGGRGPIMVRTTKYRRSFQVRDLGPFYVRVYSNEIRDSLLQLGGVGGLGRHVPPRPVTARVREAFRARQYREIVDIIRKGLIERLEWNKVGVNT